MADFFIEWIADSTITLEEGGDTIGLTYGTIDIDDIISERYEHVAEASDHPVEVGSDISDHIRKGLLRVTLECIVSNHPISSTFEHSASFRRVSLSLPQGQSQGVRALAFEEEFDRLLEVYDQLVELMDRKKLVNYIGGQFGDLEEFAILNLSVPVTNDNGIQFTMELREFRTAITADVEAPEPAVERGRNRRNRGRQSGRDNEGLQSVLSRGLERYGETIAGALGI